MNVYEVIYGQRGLKLNSGQIVRAYVFSVCVCVYVLFWLFIHINLKHPSLKYKKLHLLTSKNAQNIKTHSQS